jgi:hypothetical protein
MYSAVQNGVLQVTAVCCSLLILYTVSDTAFAAVIQYRQAKQRLLLPLR